MLLLSCSVKSLSAIVVFLPEPITVSRTLISLESLPIPNPEVGVAMGKGVARPVVWSVDQTSVIMLNAKARHYPILPTVRTS